MDATSMPANPAREWFTHDRLGMFIHFGLYSTIGRHEWVMTRERMHPDDYEQLARYFDPDRWDPAQLARAAKSAGMRYVVLTAKHHEGFCLFDSALTQYTSVRACGRDLVREFVDAVRAEGLRVGLYYSLLDWHHPHYTLDYHHPLRDDPQARAADAERQWPQYRAYLHGQVRELLSNYGSLDYLFFDFTYDRQDAGWAGKGPDHWAAAELLALCRELQPDMLVNDRLGVPADVVTPEQYQPSEPLVDAGVPLTWEVCHTLNGSWGYDRDNLAFKEPDLVARMMGDTVSKGGNLLLNIGPDGRGAVAPADGATLDALSGWMETHASAIHGAGPSDFNAPPGCIYTQRGDRLYLHLHAWPFGHVHLAGLDGRIAHARFLHDGTVVRVVTAPAGQTAETTRPGAQPPGTATLELTAVRPAVLVPVIEIFLSDAGAQPAQ